VRDCLLSEFSSSLSPPDAHIAEVIEAMKVVADELGLQGTS